MIQFPDPSEEHKDTEEGLNTEEYNPSNDVESIRQDENGYPQENMMPPGIEPEYET